MEQNLIDIDDDHDRNSNRRCTAMILINRVRNKDADEGSEIDLGPRSGDGGVLSAGSTRTQCLGQLPVTMR